MRRSILGLLLGCLAAIPIGAWAQTYDAANDFSASSNPNGVWSYGYSNGAGPGGALNLHPINGSVSGIDYWKANTNGDGNPGAYHNSTASTVDIGTVEWDPGQLILHPGSNGEFSIARFTAPTSGLYQIDAAFIGQDFVGGTTTDVHVLLNSVSIFDENINGFHNAKTYSQLTALSAGDTVDAVVGQGADGTYFYDSTGTKLTLTAVPEPASLAILAMGGLALLRKRKGSQLGHKRS